MPDYFAFEAGFETGNFSEFTSETDSQNKLTCRHFVEIAEKYGQYGAALPYRGAYCAHLDLSGGTSDAYVQEDTAFDLALSETYGIRFYFQATGNLTMAASDYFTILTLQSSGPTDEAVIGIVNDAGVLKLVAAETSALAAGLGAATRSCPLILDQWHLLELVGTLDSGGSNDGTLQFWVDGYQIGTTISTLDQAVTVQARLGAIGIDAGTTAGHLFFDQLAKHTAQIGMDRPRYGYQVYLTKTGWAALGPGVIEEIVLMPGGALDNQCTVYDMHTLPLYAGAPPLTPTLNNFAVYKAEKSKGCRVFSKGAYVVLSGTAPRALVTFSDVLANRDLVRRYALRGIRG